MNEEKSFEDNLRAAMDDLYQRENAEKARKKNSQRAIAPCGCVDKCGDISKHTEDTVLEGIVLDSDDQTYESSILQDAIRFAHHVKFSN